MKMSDKYLRKTVYETICDQHLFSPGDKVLVAVSGGPDSLCLLHLLSTLKTALGITLHVAHVNHGLRAEASAEACFVKRWAIRLGVPVTVCRVNVRALQVARGCSLQDAARRARYRCLQKTAVRCGASCIAMAHHLDDRVETLLLRLLSGSGLDGLAGIPLKRELAPNLFVVRPFHFVWREEIENYCRIHRLKPVLDKSNESLRYLRNHVRLRLVPYLEKQFGFHVKRLLAGSCDLLSGDRELLQELTADAYRHTVRTVAPDRVTVDLTKFSELPRALKHRLLQKVLWVVGIERPARVHIENILALLAGSSPAARVSLPGGVTAVREYNELHVGRMLPPKKVGQKVQIELKVPGETVLPWSGQIVRARILPVDKVSLPLTDRNEACLDLETLNFPLYVRTRRPGDRMKQLGAVGSRKIKKILIDRKVPLPQRNRIPLVISGGQVAWLGGVEICDLFRVTEMTRQVLYLTLPEEDQEKEGEN